MTDFSRIGVAVIGTGFIGTVHVWALRRLGVDLRGVLGSSPERGAEAAKGLGTQSFSSLEELCADTSVQAVHVTSPNHLHYPQVKALIAAGKHVVCEKPLTMTAAESAELVELAAASGLTCAVCYNIRFYPLNQQAHGMVAAGDLGDLRLVTGHYVQDWLAKPTDWNWRLEGDKGGALRAVGDIGTHWADLTSFIAGEKPVEVLAELSTFIKQRDKPTGPVATFSAASGATEKVTVTTEDTALILLRYPSGARGSLTVSQVSPGRKNSLRWDIAGSAASAEWNSETPDHLFIGHRDGANQILQRDAALMNATGAAAASLPGGHVEGFADTFFALFRQVYGDIAAGGRQPGSTWASFADGHFEMEFCEAVLASAQSGAWVKIGS
ncbi:Gfo/Idh/MocA family oxidoreductase [Vannielia litorea]|uniref:Gfo/Idh/MocA family protein n=1 Tax=Vannielia litorea TaxID=1217970 RepID=UPI001C953A6D|nr:Gfo/Idh/MocA family oxidoreductase [Vannielia litorea]MBY6153143.1 Gfo/Idh/MocA family oxidoreductase [Vannielia litorea]